MSCPYLERGVIALCRAVGKRGMELNPGEAEMDCFSGDFSQCSLLASHAQWERRILQPSMIQRKVPEKGGARYGSGSYLPAS